MHLPDVGFDALFRKSYVVVCLILFVFIEQQAPLSPARDCWLLRRVPCRSLWSCEGDVAPVRRMGKSHSSPCGAGIPALRWSCKSPSARALLSWAPLRPLVWVF